MQPYIFPYIGYFQLIRAVDKFVFFDDVNYIKKGWVNRNQILVNKKSHLFTVPLKAASQNILINKVKLAPEYLKWRDKFLTTVKQSYKKAPFFAEIFDLIVTSLNHKDNIRDLCFQSTKLLLNYLGLNTNIECSSSKYRNAHLIGKERILDICKKEKCSTYINSIRGVELYDFQDFKNKGLVLKFIKTKPLNYKQFENVFVPNLSIIDVLMFNGKKNTLEIIDNYKLIN